MKRNGWLAVGLALVTCAGADLAVAPTVSAAAQPPPRAAVAAGPFATLLFSRTEITAADNCVPNDTGIARIDTVVAPYLRSLGMAATGTLVTARTQPTADACTHYNDSLTASWADASMLAQSYGWTFASHTATYPGNLGKLKPAQAYAETCGSAATIDAHGLPGGHGLIAYPGAQGSPTALQTNYAASCFAWGRRFNYTGTTTASAGTTPPYWQLTKAVNGGACNLVSAPCYTIPSVGNPRYNLPAPIIARIKALKAGQWFTLQAYVLVTGASPTYTSNATRWDCTSADPKLHWSNDNERYCLSDWEQIVGALAARPDITVTDPLTVGIAFGRPATY